jgi:hypothetical protein
MPDTVAKTCSSSVNASNTLEAGRLPNAKIGIGDGPEVALDDPA